MDWNPTDFDEPDADSVSMAAWERREKAYLDFDLDQAHEALMEEVRDAINEQSRESVRAYYGRYGDAVAGRVLGLLADASALLDGYPAVSLVLAAGAIEVTLGYLVVRPLLQGAFLSDEWAEVLTSRIVRARVGEDRQIVPAIASAWGRDISDLTLVDGRGVWVTITSDIFPKRNLVLHQGDAVAQAQAETAIACARAVLHGLVEPIARELRMEWPHERWSKQQQGFTGYPEDSPFAGDRRDR